MQEGYREGITAGKLANLQAGFDEGFTQSSAVSRQLGFLRGSSSSLLAFLLASSSSRHPGPSSTVVSLDEVISDTRTLVGRLSRVRPTDIVPFDKEAEAHAREHDGVDWEEGENKEMEDLEKALEGVGKKEEDKEKVDLGELEDVLEALLVRAGLRG